MGIVLCLVALLIIFIVVVNTLQEKKPKLLPKFLRTWKFLPKPLRSLEVYDKLLFKYVYCCKCCNKLKNIPGEETDTVPIGNNNIVINENERNNGTIQNGTVNESYVVSHL